MYCPPFLPLAAVAALQCLLRKAHGMVQAEAAEAAVEGATPTVVHTLPVQRGAEEGPLETEGPLADRPVLPGGRAPAACVHAIEWHGPSCLPMLLACEFTAIVGTPAAGGPPLADGWLPQSPAPTH